MSYSLMADFVVGLHVAFVLFVVAGGILALKWRGVIWCHLPAALWGTLVEFTGWTCPLTPLEFRLRRLAGQNWNEVDFITRYLIPFLYPEDLTREIQVLLGTGVIAINVVLYGWLWRQWRRRGAQR